jgi:hypothetical protein
MAQIICIRLNWNHTAMPLGMARKFFTLEVNPEAAYPFGRKGLALAQAWKQLAIPDTAGMLLLDGDVAIDPLDQEHMLKAIDKEPHNVVHTAPVILWPVSTHLEYWVWGHGGNGRYTQVDNNTDLDMFTFCYTYLPRKLVESCVENGLAQWTYPTVDYNVCKEAKSIKMGINVVRDAKPKHLNY